MNLGKRSRLSLCQLLLELSYDEMLLLLNKYEFETDELENRWNGVTKGQAVRDAVLNANPLSIRELMQEIARARGRLRNSVSPRYRFDERWRDLSLCIQLDGYALGRDEYGNELDQFVPIEPALEGADTAEDDLTKELRRSRISKSEDVIRLLEESANLFRSGDFLNGCLNNARVALQTLATEIAQARISQHPAVYDPSKWGQVIAYLRKSGFLAKEQEEGLSGVFSFLSPGSHVPIGLSEQEFARLGRSFAVSMCYFLSKQYNASER